MYKMPDIEYIEKSKPSPEEIEKEIKEAERKEYFENIRFTLKASIWYLIKEFKQAFIDLYRAFTTKRNYVNGWKLVTQRNNLTYLSLMVFIFLLIKNPKINYIFLNIVVIIFIFASKLTSGRFKGEYREYLNQRLIEKNKLSSVKT